jgi:hypothetical protein
VDEYRFDLLCWSKKEGKKQNLSMEIKVRKPLELRLSKGFNGIIQTEFLITASMKKQLAIRM